MECRLCLRSVSEQSSVPIFGDRNLAQETIWKCCQLQLKKDNWLPSTICLSCDSNLKSLMAFKTLSFQNDAQTRQALVEYSNIKVEEVILDDLVWEDEELDSNSKEDPSDLDRSILKSITVCDVASREKKFLTSDDLPQSFVRKVNLMKKPHTCNICSKCYVHKTKLVDHMKSHTGEKPYKCDMCSKSFAIKDSLSQHIKYHIGEKLQKCDICLKGFVRKHQLTVHMNSHNGEKPYQCDICSKSFVGKDNLYKHIKHHSGKKPYKCEICSKCFVITGELTRHMKYHTGKRPYKCKICSKCYVLKGKLTAHEKLHKK